MERIPTAADPTKINLRQADLLRRLGEGQVYLRDEGEARSAKVLTRLGLITVHYHSLTDLGRQVLAGGLVHTDTEQDADGNTHLFVFLNGRQAGEVKHDPECFPPLGRGSKWTAGWIGVMPNGDQREFERKAAAVAWVAGGAR